MDDIMDQLAWDLVPFSFLYDLYKSWFKNGRGKKSGVSMALTIAFLFLVVTGIILLVAINGPNSGVGISHLAVGLLLIVLSCIHIIKRLKALTKMLKK